MTEDDLSADRRAILPQLAKSALMEPAAMGVVSIGRALFKHSEPSDPELQLRYRLLTTVPAAPLLAQSASSSPVTLAPVPAVHPSCQLDRCALGAAFASIGLAPQRTISGTMAAGERRLEWRSQTPNALAFSSETHLPIAPRGSRSPYRRDCTSVFLVQSPPSRVCSA